jgi:hypothetical protein
VSTTLSKGYRLPDTGDRGSSFYPDLENNIELSNSHTHNGTDGERINVKDLTVTSQTLASGSWSADLGGSTYRQLVTLPAGMTFNDMIPKFQVSGGGDDGIVIHPTVVKVSSTTYYAYVNDNAIAVLVTYV